MADDIFFVQPDWQLFANVNTLPQQAGVPKYLLPKLVAKELTDNALDVDSEVSISQITDENYTNIITITNAGKPFPGDDNTIADFFSIRRPLTSSKRLRLPSRGALGNGLRVVAATVYGLKGKLTLATQGRKLWLQPQDDGTTQADVVDSFEGNGTQIEISIPDNIFGDSSLEWAEMALKLNQGEKYNGKTHPLWYDSDSFFGLLQTIPTHISWHQFLEVFEGISPAKAKMLAKNMAVASPTLTDRSQADLLLSQLRESAKEIAPKKLGHVGTLPEFPVYLKEYGAFTIQPNKGALSAEIPVVIEVFARNDGQQQTQFFVNKTPITGEISLIYGEKKVSLFGCGLNEFLETPKLKTYPTIWINIITPYMPIVSNGKEPDMAVVAELLSKIIPKALVTLKKHNPQSSSQEMLFWQERSPSQKQVVIEHVNQGIAKASGEGLYRYSLRQLYYVLRPIVIEKTGKELKYANFSNIITDYEQELGQDLDGIYRDERGTLLHPHSHQEMKLGTKNVEKYRRPVYNFNKILYSEKEGFFEILKEAGFCERHDCALLTSKGFASRAARDVIDLLATTEEELIFFCIHDADISGTLIYQALQGATRARPERKVKIINIGLEPWEGLQMGLEVERLEKESKKNPAQYVLNYEQQPDGLKPIDVIPTTYFSTWTEWLRNFRIELNAMDTPTFIKWLDQKISQYDNGKVVPNPTYLRQEAESVIEVNLKQQIKEELLKQMRIEEQVLQRFKNLYPQLVNQVDAAEIEKLVRADLGQNPQQSWAKPFQQILADLLRNTTP